MDRPEIVRNLPKYLQEQLDKIATNVKFLEYTVQADNGSNHGDGFMAAMIGITLKGTRYHNGSKMNYELPLICKLMPDNVARRELFSSVVLFEREIYFYKEILPIFIDFLEEKKIHVDDEFSSYPKCFAALSEPKSDQYFIIMENLKTLGYELWDKKVPIDFDNVANVFNELGKFHAISFAIRDQRQDTFDKMFRVREAFFDMFKGNGLAETMVSGAIQKTIDLLDNKVEIDVMENVKENYEVWIKELLKEDAAGRFSVLNHGDLWNNNMMFKSQSNVSKLCERPSIGISIRKVKLCFYWQFARIRATRSG